MKKFALAFLLLPWICHAAGYALYDLSAAASGQGNAYICRVAGPSAVWYNPAALANLEGNQLAISSTWHHTHADFTSDVTTLTDQAAPQNLLPTSVFYSHQFANDLVLGFGAYTPYAFKFQWPLDSPTSFLSESSEFRTLYFTPSVGMRLSPNITVGGGFDLVYADINLRQNISGTVYRSRLSANTTNYGFNLGALIDTNSNVRFAITYKSKINLNMDGDVVYAGAFPGLPLPPPIVFPNGQAHASLPLPEQVMLGAATTFDNWDFEGNLDWAHWGRFSTFDIDFDRNSILIPDVTIPREWHDTWSVRLGTEYHVSDEFSLKGGYIYDTTPQPSRTMDPVFADADRNGFAMGIGWNDPNWRFDIGYTHLFFQDRTSPNNLVSAFAAGKYTQSHNLLAVGFEYRWE